MNTEKNTIIDERGYINEAMQKKFEEIQARKNKPKQQGTVIPVNPNTRIINRGK